MSVAATGPKRLSLIVTNVRFMRIVKKLKCLCIGPRYRIGCAKLIATDQDQLAVALSSWLPRCMCAIHHRSLSLMTLAARRLFNVQSRSQLGFIRVGATTSEEDLFGTY